MYHQHLIKLFIIFNYNMNNFTCNGLGHMSSLINSAISSELGSPWSVNQSKNDLCFNGLLRPFNGALVLALFVKSAPSFQRIGVLWDAGSPAKKQEIHQNYDYSIEFYFSPINFLKTIHIKIIKWYIIYMLHHIFSFN